MPENFHPDEHRKFEAVLRGVRAEQKVTQAEVAERMGVFQGRVSRFESGERRMDLVELRHWCIAVGVSLDDVVRRFEAALGDKQKA